MNKQDNSKQRLFEVMSRLDENFDYGVADANRDDVLSFQELSVLQKLIDLIKSRFDAELTDENIDNIKEVLCDSFGDMIRGSKLKSTLTSDKSNLFYPDK
jgi:hypothetical protein